MKLFSKNSITFAKEKIFQRLYFIRLRCGYRWNLRKVGFSSNREEMLYHLVILERSCHILGFLAQRSGPEHVNITKDHDSFFMMKLSLKFMVPFLPAVLDPTMRPLWDACTNYTDRISLKNESPPDGLVSLCVGISLIFLSTRDGEIDKSKLKKRVEITLGPQKEMSLNSPIDCIEIVIRNLQSAMPSERLH